MQVGLLATAWYRLTHPLFALWWRLRRPVTLGVKAIVTDDAGRVLLVRSRLGASWALPGGGVHAGEAPEDAAAREVREETGIDVFAAGMRLLGVMVSQAEGKTDYVMICAAEVAGSPEPRASLEVAEAGWFGMEALPEGATPRTRARLAAFRAGEQMRGAW